MVFTIRKSIDIVSPSDGKRYTSITEYERSLESKGQYIMEDKTFRELKERLQDEVISTPKPRDNSNHVHIDLANDTIQKSHRDLETNE